MSKVIFLDVDGVLNIFSDSYYTTRFREDGSIKHIEEHLVERLLWLMNKTGAVLCISSSWRGDMDDLQLQMEKSGFNLWDRVVGKTPSFYNGGRGDEIAAWIANRTNIEKYVVLEDEIDDVCGKKCSSIPREFVVEVNMKTGITDDDVKKAIEILS